MHSLAGIMLLLLLTLSGYSQRSNLLSRAEQAYEESQYREAISFLDEALEYAGQYDTKEQGELFFLRGSSYFKLSERPDWHRTFPEALLFAHRDLTEAGQKVTRGRIYRESEEKLSALPAHLLQHAQFLLQRAQEPTTRPPLQQRWVRQALAHTRIAGELKADDYRIPRLRGQAKLLYRDTAGALAEWEQSLQLLEAGNQAPELAAGDLQLRLAEVEYRFHRDPGKALRLIELGMGDLEKAFRSLSTPNDSQYQLYESTHQKLGHLRERILLQNPDLLSDALEQARSRVEQTPQDFDRRLEYARLLSLQNIPEAIVAYGEAIARNENSFAAHYELGRLLYQQALEQQAEDQPENRKWSKDVAGAMETALPYLMRAQVLHPDHLELLNMLVEICRQLEKKEAYRTYRDRQIAVRGY